MNGRLWVWVRTVQQRHFFFVSPQAEILTIPLVRVVFGDLLLFLSLTSQKLLRLIDVPLRLLSLLIATSFGKTSICTPTCHQGALCRALLHEHHVLKQWTVRAVPACSRSGLGQVGGQVAPGEEGRAEGEGWLQAAVLLGRRHLEKRESGDKVRADFQ